MPPDLTTPPDLVTPATLEINYCVVQFPKSDVVKVGTPKAVFGRVYQGGLTDIRKDGPAPGIAAQLGYGPFGTDPRGNDSWTWVIATPNLAYCCWNSNDDEYQAEIIAAKPGVLGYVYRFSVTSGASFTYCDAGAKGNGSNNGLDLFDPTKAGQLTVN